MIQQAMSNPSMTSPLLALIGALGYGRSNQNELGKINQLKQSRQQFMGEVQKIASSGATPDEKINSLMGLKAQFGTDFGLGIDDIAKQYQMMSNRNSLIPVYGYDENGNLVPRGQVPKGSKVPDVIAQEKFNSEQEEKKNQKDAESELIKDSAREQLDTIAEVEKGMHYFGALTAGVPALPGTPKANWQANVGKLLSSKIIQLIKDMKKASKQGATGFGQLSDKEGQMLREASTALKINLSPEDAQRYLNDMKKSLNKIIGAEGSVETTGQAPLVGQSFNGQKILKVRLLHKRVK